MSQGSSSDTLITILILLKRRMIIVSNYLDGFSKVIYCLLLVPVAVFWHIEVLLVTFLIGYPTRCSNYIDCLRRFALPGTKYIPPQHIPIKAIEGIRFFKLLYFIFELFLRWMELRKIFLCTPVHLHRCVIYLFSTRHSHLIGDKFEISLVFV